VRVAMQKVPGVTSVKVSLNDGLTVLDLAPENSVTLGNLRQIIRNNGFVTNEAQVVARGTASSSSDGVVFEVRTSKERLAVKAAVTASAYDQLRARVKSSGPADTIVSGSVDLRIPKALTLALVKTEAP
jgi:hypothetical protein